VGKLAVDQGKHDACETLIRYRDDRQTRLAARTVQVRLAALMSTLKRLYQADVIDWTPAGLVRAPRVPKTKRRAVMSSEDWRTLRNTVSAEGSVRGARDLAILLLLRDLGLRRGSVAGLDLADLSLDRERPVARVTLKGYTGKQEKPLNARQVDAIRAWLEYRGDGDGSLFVRLPVTPDEPLRAMDGAAVYYVVRSWAKRAGLVDIHPHTLRAHAATELARKGFSLDVVSSVLDHESWDTTQAYVSVSLDREGLAVDALGED